MHIFRSVCIYTDIHILIFIKIMEQSIIILKSFLTEEE